MKPDNDLITAAETRLIFDRLAPELERYRLRNRYYHRSLTALVRTMIPEGASMLDLGCGQGDLLAALSPRRGLGIDISAAMIARARAKYPSLSFRVADIESFDPEDRPGQFDAILIANTVGFLTDIQQAIRNCRRFAGPRTRLVITHYNHLWEPVLKAAEKLGLKMPEPYQNWLSSADLKGLCTLEGFEVVCEEEALLLPLNIPLLAPLCNRWLAHLPGLRRLALVQALVARPLPPPPAAESHSCTVVVPARNEKGNIAEIAARIPEMGKGTEIIFVEGHSVDGTWEECQRVIASHPERKMRLLRQPGEGKGDAVRAGFAAASGEILMILDADMTVLPEELTKFYEALAAGKGELVMGCRLVYRLQRESMRFLNLLGNKFFSLAFTFILSQRIKDTLCGTKALRRDDYRRIAGHRLELARLDPFGDFELIFGAALGRMKIIEVPVRYHARRYGTTQIRRFRHGLLLLRMVLWGVFHVKFRR